MTKQLTTPPKIEIRSAPLGTPDLVTFFAKGTPLPPGLLAAEFEGAPSSLLLLREGAQRQLLVGLGEANPLEPDTIRRAAGAAIKHLLKLGANRVALDLTPWPQLVGPALEGALLASYKFEGFGLPAARRKRSVLERLQVIVPESSLAAAKRAGREAELVANRVNQMRQIGNLPANYLNPALLAAEAKKLAAGRSLTVKVWDEARLKREKFGGILGVGQGSLQPPRLIVLEYNGGPKGQPPVALVGKAVTFDTGGISLKPGAAMDEMKWDKMGGLAVLGILLAAADLKLPLNLVGLIPAAENMPGPAAYRPGDILTTYDGKTVEVLNTDAEGRIILADAIAYARLTYRPAAILEYSTLTGACVMALGYQRAGLFTSETLWRDRFVAAGEVTGEKVWPLPIDEEYKEDTYSEIATTKNVGGREGSACTSASFIKTWAESTPFVHFDIAGTAWTTKPPAHLEGGATGYGIRLTLAALRAGEPPER